MDFDAAREKMVLEQLVDRGIKNQEVIRAFLKVPRHLFVEQALRERAYGDYPLPIGLNQTISQPYMVALMCELLELKGNEKVLEIGTGSGYETAILAELAERVFSIERLDFLTQNALTVLDKLKYNNVVTKVTDGTYGWREESPFDGIVVTAASPQIPKRLLDQLAVKRHLVIPIGEAFSQTLFKITKAEKGFDTKSITGCVFVKLIGKYGWENEN
ncbi:MAG: protein-L-isoaspartate(D-aspartate) O-methyltransferase [Nitrospinota bacterium]|nr:protein-L-isoaspartate(D-aspartate) O-methyltransferase [Nitrospinota bacterium]MDP7579800.1 protein-L-isoaspartate(D-aspartate) O-methyltransferase [Nitrospinota bacterium]HJN02939.1 protein-L-isoaspartate(D-aspartate) O-methyltransferase [Nitrospinota bacterium]